MQFHHHGYVSGDPRVLPAAGVGIDRPEELPDEIDVLIVGSGPAGMLLSAQLSQYPDVVTRIIERRDGRLVLGQADGIQPRSVETFQAFGFAERIIAEAYNIGYMNFWGPDPADPQNIIRTSRTEDYGYKISEFPHLIVNQARVLDYFAEAAAHGPGRIVPDYGIEFTGLTVHEEGSEGAASGYPVEVRVRYTAGERAGEERTVRAKYVAGCDGARSGVREAIGRKHIGAMASHAWGVMDVVVNTDFPDWRTKCAINSEAGNILHIPREGGYLSRMYIDLGAVAEDDDHEVRKTPIEAIIAKANDILHPYTLDVRQVAWFSVYEVGHRVTDHFDDRANDDEDASPRVFLTGDACHTHSAKAGQGMNVSMQDGFNLGWKLGSVVSGLAPASLLSTYSAERQPVAQQLIDFDREWSSLMARKPEEISDPQELATFYLGTAEFPSGFMTQYGPSMITGDAAHQELATGFPIGKRFKSSQVSFVCDGNVVHLGHHAKADGRWRVYAFADAPAAGEASALTDWAEWMATTPESPVSRFTPAGADVDAVFDVKAIYQQRHDELDITRAPEAFRPKTGPLALMDWEKVFAAGPSVWCPTDIFEERGISRDGAVVVVRPDGYVAHVLPLTATAELGEFFAGQMLER
ncbi:FAD-binding monooxygenase [Agromyces sp. H3Y2-19a]|uniref:FAD-binding monooxygenase n=1 Tax=Agromyces chromiiresistens TaxID=3030835 RepID=UPI0023B8B916|nr:FAD-binding monooxygenase [Agromyces chromiiresistens]MDF0515403.1 FAD-binding monooxygenase [Agromyces chromiiresistens]